MSHARAATFLLCYGGHLGVLSTAAEVLITVDKSAQRMMVAVDGPSIGSGPSPPVVVGAVGQIVVAVHTCEQRIHVGRF